MTVVIFLGGEGLREVSIPYQDQNQHARSTGFMSSARSSGCCEWLHAFTSNTLYYSDRV